MKWYPYLYVGEGASKKKNKIIRELKIGAGMFDVWVMITFGFVGYLLICLGIDMAPVILGFILGPLIEKYMRMALISANGNWGDIMARPVAVFFVIIAVLFVVVPMIRKAKKATKKAQ